MDSRRYNARLGTALLGVGWIVLLLSGCAHTPDIESPSGRLSTVAEQGIRGGAAQAASRPGGRHLGTDLDRAPEVGSRIVDLAVPSPDWQRATSEPRYYPFFDHEDPWASVSVGTTSDGWLANGVAIPPSTHLAILPRNYENALNYGTAEMVELLLQSGERVSYGFPGTMLFVGHIAKQNGGDIDYSVSHNNGRDADIAYYSTNPFGWQSRPTHYMHFGRNARSDEHWGFYRFDTPRNAELVRALFESNAAQPQYMFAANHLRRRILNYLTEHDMSEDALAQLRSVLREPGGGALPHDDHLHLRILCSEADVCGGCVNTGIIHSWMSSYSNTARMCTDEYAQMATHAPDPEQRARGVERIGLMDAQVHGPLVIAALDDPLPRVRAAAARTLGEFKDPRNTQALVDRDGVETEAEVRCVIAVALGSISKKDSLAHLAVMMGEDLDCPVGDDFVPLAVVAARVSADSESRVPVPALIARLEDPRPEVRGAASGALRMLTNRHVKVNDELIDWASASLSPDVQATGIAEWQKWHARWADKSRDRWLIAGFKSCGFDVDQLERAEIPDLVAAIQGPAYVSWNARRALWRVTGIRKRTWEWEPEKAAHYWRIVMRWRGQEFGLD